MSERYERSFSDRGLLLDASLSDAKPGIEREALAKYKQTLSKSIASNDRLQELNEMIKEMSFSGEKGSEKFVQSRAEAEQCVRDISEFDREADIIMNSSLLPLVKRLKEKAHSEEQRLGQIALENHYQNEAAQYEQVAQKWRVERDQAISSREKKQSKKKSKELCALENEIGDVRKQVRQIEEDLSHLKFCWFGEKRRYKTKLEAEKTILQNHLLELYRRRRLL